jgi:hypothetical protein
MVSLTYKKEMLNKQLNKDVSRPEKLGLYILSKDGL